MALHRRGGIAVVAGVLLAGSPAAAQKAGGTLRIYNTTQPPSASIHEESTIATNMPNTPRISVGYQLSVTS